MKNGLFGTVGTISGSGAPFASLFLRGEICINYDLKSVEEVCMGKVYRSKLHAYSVGNSVIITISSLSVLYVEVEVQFGWRKWILIPFNCLNYPETLGSRFDQKLDISIPLSYRIGLLFFI